MALNGRLPASDLGYITGTGHRVLRELVAQTVALRAAFEAHFGKPLTITDSYRDYDAQVRVKAAKGYLAATPGFSNHGWGVALDLGSYVNRFGSDEHEWMRENGPRFGWHHPTWARRYGSKPEAWHWEASAGAVPVTNYRDAPTVTVPTPTGVLPTPLTPTEEPDMRDALIALYLNATGRMPDVVGFQHWIPEVATGRKTWADVERELRASEESAAFAALGSEEARNAKRAESGFVI